MTSPTNGYLVRLLVVAAEDTSHEDHSRAQSLLQKFRAMEGTFFEEVHPHVDIGLAIHEVQVAGRRKPNIFTTHGCRHISTLIESLDRIAQSIALARIDGALNVLEAYLLLSAAHVHDAANIIQREGHPQRCDEIMARYKPLFSGSAEMEQIYDIARVHGGKHEVYGKDTFRSLRASNVQPPRVPLLAAALRLGDELSENPERVPELVARHHEHSEETRLAFAYATSFRGFALNGDSLSITYNLYPAQRDLSVQVSGAPVSFLEFLEGKLDVIDREARYCSQYGRPILYISQIRIAINRYARPLPTEAEDTLTFSWQLLDGYPQASEPLCQRSTELKDRGLKRLQDYFGDSRGGGLGVRALIRQLLRERT